MKLAKPSGILSVFITGLLWIITPSIAAETALPVTVKLLSCGPTVQAACQRDDRCCVLLEGKPDKPFDVAQNEDNQMIGTFGYSVDQSQISVPISVSYSADKNTQTQTYLLQ